VGQRQHRTALSSFAVAPTLVSALLAAMLAACGVVDFGASAGLPTSGQQYDGPLFVTDGRYGAAGQIVDCRHGARAGGFERAKVYDSGATSDTVQDALETAYSEGMFLEAPKVELAIAKTESDRVLLTYDDDAGEVRVAVVFHDGRATEGAGGDGWYRESWARCDLSEFPAPVAESYFGYQIWMTADGEPALTSKIVSFPGSEHCDWQSTTFLALGEGGPDGSRDAALYAAHPQAEIEPYLQGEYVADMPLPDDAVATPFSRDGGRLWLSPDRKYAYIGAPRSVEAWPRTQRAFGCE
jgi:hypothetical protein